MVTRGFLRIFNSRGLGCINSIKALFALEKGEAVGLGIVFALNPVPDIAHVKETCEHSLTRPSQRIQRLFFRLLIS